MVNYFDNYCNDAEQLNSIAWNFFENFTDFDENCIKQLLKQDAEIFLIGTGQLSKFPEKPILQYIAQHKLSIDFMDTGAASRTFNILTGENRKVAALIFFDQTDENK